MVWDKGAVAFLFKFHKPETVALSIFWRHWISFWIWMKWRSFERPTKQFQSFKITRNEQIQNCRKYVITFRYFFRIFNNSLIGRVLWIVVLATCQVCTLPQRKVNSIVEGTIFGQFFCKKNIFYQMFYSKHAIESRLPQWASPTGITPSTPPSRTESVARTTDSIGWTKTVKILAYFTQAGMNC